MDGQPQLGVVLAHRPGEGERPPMSREKRRVGVDDAEPRDGEDLRWEQPRVPGAQPDLRLVGLRQTQKAGLVRREADIEIVRAQRSGSRSAAPLPPRLRAARGVITATGSMPTDRASSVRFAIAGGRWSR